MSKHTERDVLLHTHYCCDKHTHTRVWRKTTGVLGDVSMCSVGVHRVRYSVWFQQGREVFVFHLLPFISSSLVNWYWGHCLHKPSFPLKKEEGRGGGGGGERSRKYRERQNIMRKQERHSGKRERKKLSSVLCARVIVVCPLTSRTAHHFSCSCAVYRSLSCKAWEKPPARRNF